MRVPTVTPMPLATPAPVGSPILIVPAPILNVMVAVLIPLVLAPCHLLQVAVVVYAMTSTIVLAALSAGMKTVVFIVEAWLLFA